VPPSFEVREADKDFSDEEKDYPARCVARALLSFPF
jgi:hypothetical protein